MQGEKDIFKVYRKEKWEKRNVQLQNGYIGFYLR